MHIPKIALLGGIVACCAILSFCPLRLSSIPGPKLDPCVRKGASNAITILYSSTTTLCTTSLHRPGTDHVRAAAAGGRPCFQSLWPSHSKEWPLK